MAGIAAGLLMAPDKLWEPLTREAKDHLANCLASIDSYYLGNGWYKDGGMEHRDYYVAFYSACVFADVKPYPLGIIKGIINRHLNYWLDSPIQDFAGILGIGYHYPNLIMAEGYNAPGSPLWSLKAFAILALDDEHEFWSVSEEALPELDMVKTLPEAEMIITRQTMQQCFPMAFTFRPHQ